MKMKSEITPSRWDEFNSEISALKIQIIFKHVLDSELLAALRMLAPTVEREES